MKHLTTLAALLLTAAPAFADRDFNCTTRIDKGGYFAYVRGCESTSTTGGDVGLTPIREVEEGEGEEPVDPIDPVDPPADPDPVDPPADPEPAPPEHPAPAW